jgi:hypothetical protein
MGTPITTALEAELDAALHETLDENDELKAENAALKAENSRLIDWIMGADAPDALVALQRVYSDPATPLAERIKSCGLAIAYERARPASTTVATVFHLADYWQAREKVVEQVPALALEGPSGDPAA